MIERSLPSRCPRKRVVLIVTHYAAILTDFDLFRGSKTQR